VTAGKHYTYSFALPKFNCVLTTNRDRTAQLTALAQLMIDPFYRTVEGFLCLLQKEFSAFGHKFEDRLGRRGHSKEVSPVCLQYLDCVWQMQRQFATAFEFSAGLVTLLSQCMYSGLFVNFRRNSERERVQMMRNVGPYEDMQSDDFDFSTLAAYVNLLLRTPGVAALLLNANYIPPRAAQKQVRILSVTYRRAPFRKFHVPNAHVIDLSVLFASTRLRIATGCLFAFGC
jgi:hypothetical protein